MGRTEGEKALKCGEAVDVCQGASGTGVPWVRAAPGPASPWLGAAPTTQLPGHRRTQGGGSSLGKEKSNIHWGLCSYPPPVWLALHHQGTSVVFFLARNKKRNYLLCRKGGVCVRLC